MGEAPDGRGPIWWILTPTGDIYPEELEVPPLTGLAISDLAGGRVRGTMKPAGRRLDAVYEFVEGRGPGELLPQTVVKAMRAAERQDAKARGTKADQSESGPRRRLNQTGPRGRRWGLHRESPGRPEGQRW